jgi:hypothetical protein
MCRNSNQETVKQASGTNSPVEQEPPAALPPPPLPALSASRFLFSIFSLPQAQQQPVSEASRPSPGSSPHTSPQRVRGTDAQAVSQTPTKDAAEIIDIRQQSFLEKMKSPDANDLKISIKRFVYLALSTTRPISLPIVSILLQFCERGE